jgi:hypothetical protein
MKENGEYDQIKNYSIPEGVVHYGQSIFADFGIFK